MSSNDSYIDKLEAEIIRLKDLNRELAGVLELMVNDRSGNILQDGSILQVVVLKLLAKAEGSEC